MAKQPNILELMPRFPTDDDCLEHIMQTRYGLEGECAKCERETKYHRVRKRKCYECQFCGHHIYPCAGTPFEKSRTSLRLWFYAMYLFCSTRNGVSAKEIQRQTGVTYKTAWRMAHEIRKYMGWIDGDGPPGGNGVVEAEKTFIGGKDERGKVNKSIVLDIVQRGGEILPRVIPSKLQASVVHHIPWHVPPDILIATDESKSFRKLNDEDYRHGTISPRKGGYVRGPVHTKTIEGFWRMLKRGIHRTHVCVSEKHQPKYLTEFDTWFNLRNQPHLMFDRLLQAAPVPSASP